MLDITINNRSGNSRIPKNDFFIETSEIALIQTGFGQRRVGLSINLVRKTEIRTLNKKFRGRDSVTDIISFPIQEVPSPVGDAKKKTNDILELGDIFLCPSAIEISAKKEKTDPVNMFRLLVVHGVLHLLGYDHEKTAKEGRKMSLLQDKIIKKCLNR